MQTQTLPQMLDGLERGIAAIRATLGIAALTSAQPPLPAVARAPRTTTTKVKRNRSKGEEPSLWLADKNARRVPTFVIKATGLDTKKAIVARFGVDARFEAGKPLPEPRIFSTTAAPSTTSNGMAKKRSKAQPVQTAQAS